MSRPSNPMEPSRFTSREGGGFRRMSQPLTANNYNNSPELAASRSFPTPPAPRGTSVRPDRLSLRLRSNSNFKSSYNSMNDSPPDSLGGSQQSLMYKNGFSGSSVDLSGRSSGISTPRLASISSRQSMPAPPMASLDSWVPLLDCLGREAFQLAMESSSIAHQLLRYCEDRGCDQNMDFLMKVSNAQSQSTYVRIHTPLTLGL